MQIVTIIHLQLFTLNKGLLYALIEWVFKSFQHILGYLMTFPVLLVEEDLRIIQTE